MSYELITHAALCTNGEETQNLSLGRVFASILNCHQPLAPVT